MTAPAPQCQPKTTDAPHVPAAFINAIAEEGTKAEAVQWLQKQWNENWVLRARIEELERTVDLLESNARVQAKLLADTGRRAEAMEAALDAMRCDGCPPADRSTDKTSCKACPYRAGGALQSEKTT